MPHAFLSPSGAPAWMRCNAKPWREKYMPDQNSDASAEGTAAHFLLEQCLIQNLDAASFIGCSIDVSEITKFHVKGQWPVNADMAREVQKVLDLARSDAEGATIYSEQVLPISQFTGEEGATGTCDMITVRGKVIRVRDLKFGRGVQVFAEGNEQLLIYGGAALDEFDVMGEVETLELCIDQPRLNHFDMWVLPVSEARERLAKIRETADLILKVEFVDEDGHIHFASDQLTAVPGEKQCKFCKVKATCEENREHLLGTVVEGFVDLDKGFVKVEMPQAEKLLAQAFGVKPAAIHYQESAVDENEMHVESHFTIKKPNIRPALEEAELKLVDASDERLATLMDAADSLEGFVKAVRAETERRLLAGKFTDARYKLVEGRMGNREFEDEEAAEAEMKAMRLKVDEMYNKKLISAPQAEKLLKDSNPRKWAKLQKMIVQRQGKPSVAPASDKRPALSIAIAEQFDVLTEEDRKEIAQNLEQTTVENNFDDLV